MQQARRGISWTGWSTVLRKVRKSSALYILFAPVFIYYVMFRFIPLGGIVIAFKDYNLFYGISDSIYVGTKHFIDFFSSIYFSRLLRNTLAINALNLLICFPAPILLALCLNEVKCTLFKRTVQTISYLPHFISTVIIVSIVTLFLSPETGLVNRILNVLGHESIFFLSESKYFWGIFTVMTLWQTIGWNSILYLAALTGIDPTLYEAAVIDGAGRWKQTLVVTLPSIKPTIIMLFIIQVGKMMDVGYEPVILLYNPTLYETADVFGSYVYRRGLAETNYSYAAAVGLFQAVFSMILVISANSLCKRFAESSMW